MPNKDTAYQIAQDAIAKAQTKNGAYAALYGSTSRIDTTVVPTPTNMLEFGQLIDLISERVDMLRNIKKD